LVVIIHEILVETYRADSSEELDFTVIYVVRLAVCAVGGGKVARFAKIADCLIIEADRAILQGGA